MTFSAERSDRAGRPPPPLPLGFRSGEGRATGVTRGPFGCKTPRFVEVFFTGSHTAVGLDVAVKRYPNPRIEAESHYYNAANTKLRDLGLAPHHLGEELVRSMLGVIERHRERVIPRAILPRTTWRPGELSGELSAPRT